MKPLVDFPLKLHLQALPCPSLVSRSNILEEKEARESTAASAQESASFLGVKENAALIQARTT